MEIIRKPILAIVQDLSWINCLNSVLVILKFCLFKIWELNANSEVMQFLLKFKSVFKGETLIWTSLLAGLFASNSSFKCANAFWLNQRELPNIFNHAFCLSQFSCALIGGDFNN